MPATLRTDRDAAASRLHLDGVHLPVRPLSLPSIPEILLGDARYMRSSALACSAIFCINRIIAFFHILYGYTTISINSISGSRYEFCRLRCEYASSMLSPLWSMRPW